MPEVIPYGRQWVDEEDLESVKQALMGDFLTTGPMVAAFESAICAYTGVGHAAVLNSGTSALHAAYAAVGLKKGDRILTSPLTFAATGNAALYLGAEPVFADIDPATGNLDPTAVAAAMDDRVRLLVPVDYAGHPADYDALVPLARERGALVVADAAHSLGARYKGRSVGTLADLTELSFHPVKPVTTAEGGAVVGADAVLVQRVTDFRSHGITRDPARLTRDEGPWYHEMHDLGFNYRLTDLQCALGLSQMRKLDRFLARRRIIAARYQEAFADCPQLVRPAEAPEVESGWHLYVVRVAGDPSRRRPFFEALRAAGLGVQVHYLPVYRHPYYEALGYRPGLCPKAEDFYARCVSLPIFPRMGEDEVDRVIDIVRRVSKEQLS